MFGKKTVWESSSFSGVGLWSLAFRDCGFESRQGPGCLSRVSAVCCRVQVLALVWFRGVLPIVVSERDSETSIMRRSWPTRSCSPLKKAFFSVLIHIETARSYAVTMTGIKNLILCDVIFIRTLWQYVNLFDTLSRFRCVAMFVFLNVCQILHTELVRVPCIHHLYPHRVLQALFQWFISFTPLYQMMCVRQGLTFCKMYHATS